MRLVFDAARANIQRQRRQEIGRRIVAAVFENLGHAETGGDVRLAARKAVVRPALKPEARIIGDVGAGPGKNVFAGSRRHAGDDFGVDAMPHRLAETRFGSFPRRAADLRNREHAQEASIDVRVPYAGRVVVHPMVDM